MPEAAPGSASVATLLALAARATGARHEAEILLGEVLRRDRAWLMAHADAVPTATEAARLRSLLDRRLAGEPLAYILGEWSFWGMDLAVSPAVLIPRPETELLVELALARLPAEGSVADLGTGSGAVALALAGERPTLHVIATDRSAAALAVARGNAQRLGLSGIEFLQGDWLEPLAGRRLTMLVGNPPYVAAGDPHLARGDLPHEPREALVAGADGLADLRRISAGAGQFLEAGGWLLLEHGADQGAAVRELLADAGFTAVFTARDLQDHERVSGGRWPPAT